MENNVVDWSFTGDVDLGGAWVSELKVCRCLQRTVRIIHWLVCSGDKTRRALSFLCAHPWHPLHDGYGKTLKDVHF